MRRCRRTPAWIERAGNAQGRPAAADAAHGLRYKLNYPESRYTYMISLQGGNTGGVRVQTKAMALWATGGVNKDVLACIQENLSAKNNGARKG